MSSLKENKMGILPMGRLLLGMALPMALSMLVQALLLVPSVLLLVAAALLAALLRPGEGGAALPI